MGVGEDHEVESVGQDGRDRSDRDDDVTSGFERLFHAHADAVLAYARRRSDLDTAQEVVSETFTIAWRRFSDIPDSSLPWLLGVARKVLANMRRTSSRQRAVALRLLEQPASAGGDPTREVDAKLSARAAIEPSSDRGARSDRAVGLGGPLTGRRRPGTGLLPRGLRVACPSGAAQIATFHGRGVGGDRPAHEVTPALRHVGGGRQE
jgi:Sigma-70 region 2